MNNAKHTLIIVKTNIILFLLVFIAVDIITFYNSLYTSWFYSVNDKKCITYFKHITRPLNEKYTKETIEKAVKMNKQYEGIERPIILFGCSFFEGFALSDKERVDYKIAKYTNSPVYNRARGGWGTQHTLFQLSSEDLYQDIKFISNEKTPLKRPKYIIYEYIDDHINRIHIAMKPIAYGGYPTFVLREKNNKFYYDKLSSFIFRFSILSFLKQTLYSNFIQPKDRAEFLKKHLLKMKEIIDYKFNINNKDTDTELIVFVYNTNYEILSIAEGLREKGIKIIYTENIVKEDLSNIKYTVSETDPHPNGAAWDILVPKLMEHIYKYDNPEYYKKMIEYERKNLLNKKYTIKFSLDNLSQQVIPSGFSIAYKDKQLINNHKLSKNKAYLAYTSFCIGHFLSSIKISFLAKPFFQNGT